MNQHQTLQQIAAECAAGGAALPAAPHVGGSFAEPWQAQAFALTVQLHARGLFSWPEWAALLSQHIRAAQASGDTDDGSTYYQHWVDALEAMVIAKQLGTPEQIHQLEHAWEAAAKRTPHGQPIVLPVELANP